MNEIAQEKPLFMPIKTDRHSGEGTSSARETEALLLAHIAGGDESALEVLFARCGERLYNYILGMLHDEHAAQDALQETLIAVWKQADRYRGEGRAIAWLYGIARNQALRQYHRPQNLPLDEESQSPAPAGGSDPEQRLQREQRREVLRQGLSALAPQYREVLDLFFLHDMKLKEIAAICRIPLGTVKSRLNHARKALKNTLARQGVSMEDLI
ncbi:MAG: hypothetical protein PWQ55_2832 [Chloroflexota bacterium]|nr:hypothetical protein [Chloroflexota bacterium]